MSEAKMPEEKMSFVPLEQARAKLAGIWFIGSGAVFIILVVQSILGKFGGRLQEVWAWFVPNVLPTLALMLGILGANALTAAQDKRQVKEFFFKLSKYLSIFYVAILALTILLEPLSRMESVQLYMLSN